MLTKGLKISILNKIERLICTDVHEERYIHVDLNVEIDEWINK